MMDKGAAYQCLAETGLLPTAFVYDVEETVLLAKTLCENGIRDIEILQRTPLARQALSAVKQALPEMMVAAGTVRTVETASAALDAGADMIITPFYSQTIVDWCNDRAVAIIPGCGTMTEISWGYESGLRSFKYFPANQLGGVEGIRQLGEIYADARYIPTGGVGYEDVLDYAACPQVLACGTVCMMPLDRIRAHDWAEIARLCRRAVGGSLGLSLAYWRSGETAAGRAVAALAELVGVYQQARTGDPPPVPELVDGAPGAAVGLYTNSLERALAYFCRMGLPSKGAPVGDKQGRPVAADLELPFEGCGVRLIDRHYCPDTAG